MVYIVLKTHISTPLQVIGSLHGPHQLYIRKTVLLIRLAPFRTQLIRKQVEEGRLPITQAKTRTDIGDMYIPDPYLDEIVIHPGIDGIPLQGHRLHLAWLVTQKKK